MSSGMRDRPRHHVTPSVEQVDESVVVRLPPGSAPFAAGLLTDYAELDRVRIYRRALGKFAIGMTLLVGLAGYFGRMTGAECWTMLGIVWAPVAVSAGVEFGRRRTLDRKLAGLTAAAVHVNSSE